MQSAAQKPSLHSAGAGGPEAGDAAAGHHQAAGRVLRLLLGVHVAPVRGVHLQPVHGAGQPAGADGRLHHGLFLTNSFDPCDVIMPCHLKVLM